MRSPVASTFPANVEVPEPTSRVLDACRTPETKRVEPMELDAFEINPPWRSARPPMAAELDAERGPETLRLELIVDEAPEMNPPERVASCETPRVPEMSSVYCGCRTPIPMEPNEETVEDAPVEMVKTGILDVEVAMLQTFGKLFGMVVVPDVRWTTFPPRTSVLDALRLPATRKD